MTVRPTATAAGIPVAVGVTALWFRHRAGHTWRRA